MKFLADTKFLSVLMIVLLIATTDSMGQKKESKKKEKSGEEVDNSFAPFKEDPNFETNTYKQTKKSTKKAKKSRKARRADRRNANYDFMNNLDQKKDEFYKRIKQNAKEDRKLARKMKKPKYSDPSYFGHKKKPKKRRLGKRKLCKECGIVH